MSDKLILTILGFEHAGFGILGLFFPQKAASLVSFELTARLAFSEVRAHYSLFLVIGLLAFLALFQSRLRRFTYQVYMLIFGSYLLGRFCSILLDGFPDIAGWFVILAELLVVLVSIWRVRVTPGYSPMK